MKKELLHTLLCFAVVGLCLLGLGLILVNIFMDPAVDLMPYALISIIAGNALNLYRKIYAAKKL